MDRAAPGGLGPLPPAAPAPGPDSPSASGDQRAWRVSNPNAETVHVTWKAPETGESGSLYAAPGATTWQTTDATLMIDVRWYDDQGRQRFDVAHAGR